MTIPELLGMAGGLLAFLATMFMALLGVIYRNDREVARAAQTALEARVSSLEKQNTEQETRIATLTATLQFAREGNDKLVATLERLDDRLDSMSREFSGLKNEIQNFVRRGFTPGTMPAVKVPR